MTGVVDEQLARLARQMLSERAPPAPERQSALAGALVPLAEFRYLGHTQRFMHEFAQRAGIKISYNGLVMFVHRHIGLESGPGSRAEQIVQAAVDAGTYESPHFQPRQGASLVSRPRNEGGTMGIPPAQEAGQTDPLPSSISPPRNEQPSKSSPLMTSSTTPVVSRARTDGMESGGANPSPTSPDSRPRNRPEEAAEQPAKAEKDARVAALNEGMKAFESPFKHIKKT